MPKLEPQGSYLQYRPLGTRSGLSANRDSRRSYTYTNSITDSYSNANPNTDTDPMHGKMCPQSAAAPDPSPSTESLAAARLGISKLFPALHYKQDMDATRGLWERRLMQIL